MQYKYRNATWSDKNKKIVRVEVLLNNVWVETCYDFNNPGDLTDLRNQIPISLIKEPVESENLISKQKQIDKHLERLIKRKNVGVVTVVQWVKNPTEAAWVAAEARV